MRTLLSFRERNRIWHLFVHPSSRQLYVDWEQAAEHALMNFRAAYDQYLGDAWFEHFLTDLQQKSPFPCHIGWVSLVITMAKLNPPDVAPCLAGKEDVCLM